jgi:hypothetical protein
LFVVEWTETSSPNGWWTIEDGMWSASGEAHSGQDRTDGSVLDLGKEMFWNGVGGEGVRDSWEEDCVVIPVGTFYVNKVVY